MRGKELLLALPPFPIRHPAHQSYICQWLYLEIEAFVLVVLTHILYHYEVVLFDSLFGILHHKEVVLFESLFRMSLWVPQIWQAWTSISDTGLLASSTKW